MLPDWVRLGSRLVRLLRDHHHAGSHDAVLERLVERARASVALREQRREFVPRVSYPPDLPITARKDDIVAAIRAHQVVVIAGETGSGKTTQLPKMCLEAGLGIEAKIGCTQPRRVAALSISRRIADELNVAWGREVGCKIRFDDRSSPETYIKLMTDGILLAETQGDPLLADYNAILIDEAHERSLNIDFLLGYLKGLLAKRPELKLVITSATIDTSAFSKAFNDAPIIEVSGRVYPVEVVYAPFDAASEESGDITYIDAAVHAAGRALDDSGDGDILIFMPGERDIRETSDLLKTRLGDVAEIIPLFGRLSSGDQQRVFAPTSQRRIVVATNIAETSLTIPGIRYVIDAGLARISRYNPRTRTRRLPVEPISQSSANQRKGRSGRLRNGVCIRLYSEEDFNSRPLYTQPEIQRANLAEVILRMKAFRLGEIETFPFLNPPPPAAIQGGYRLLQELGALDEALGLTPLGRDLAHLPIDPTLGRMLLQSQQEHATRELLIIAAGLSIQDPRERPMDQKEAANSAHKRFVDPQSDFLTLLNLWNAVHDEWETLRTQNQRRKFCKAHFLSYLRMIEWQDLYAQLHEALENLGTLRLNESNAAYHAIHRAVLTGLLGHVAHRKERNLYTGVGNRQLLVFPGSALYDRTEKPKKTPLKAKTPPPPRSVAQPAWTVAGEIVETSQLFARTVAGIDPEWIVELAPHLCRITHQNPQWSPSAGRVLVEEQVTLYGLEVRKRKVAYGNVNPQDATRIFIRSALVEENLFPEPEPEETEADLVPSGAPRSIEKRASRRDLRQGVAAPRRTLALRHAFLEQNRKVRQKIETWQTRVRRHDLVDLDQRFFDYYVQRIENVSSVDELNRFLRGHPEPNFLCVTEADLTGGQDLSYDPDAFPDSVTLDGQAVALSYSYTPGEEHDGVTLKLGRDLAQSVTAASVEWAVPGLREGQVAELLRSLPKAIRRELMPFPPKVAEILRDLRPSGHSLRHDLARFLHQRYGVAVPVSAWPAEAVAPHLLPRIELVGPDHKSLGTGRDLNQLRRQLEQVPVPPATPVVASAPAEDPAWTRCARQWERFGLTGWTFGDLPSQIVVNEAVQPVLLAWPGLVVEDNLVNLRLFRAQGAAQKASLPAVRRLLEQVLQKDLAWLQKDLRALTGMAPLLAGLVSLDDLHSSAILFLKRYLLPNEPFPALTQARFNAAVEQARQRLPGLASQLIDRLEPLLKLRQDILRRIGPLSTATPAPTRLRTLADLPGPGAQRPTPTAGKPAGPQAAVLLNELAALMPGNFLDALSFERLAQFPRYLKALNIRAERALLNPLKDQERARQLAPYQEALRSFQANPPDSEAARRGLVEFHWMVEEFKISLFAQELGTAFPVSPKRLDQYLEQLRLV